MSNQMKLKKIVGLLQQVDGYENPKVALEQFQTPPETAANMCHLVGQNFGDFEGKTICDLGAGCGMLTLGSCFLGASKNFCVESDSDAIEVLKKNLEDFDVAAQCEVFELDVLELAKNPQMVAEQGFASVDTVIMNPPFGIRQKGAAIAFLKVACQISSVVYSLHKTETRGFIQSTCKRWGVKATVLSEVTIDLPPSYKSKQLVAKNEKVDFIRFECANFNGKGSTKPATRTETPDEITATENLMKKALTMEPTYTYVEEPVEDYGVAPKLDSSSGTLTGTVKFFNRGKGFGFITPDNGAADLFVHSTGVTGKTLMDDDKVSFTVVEQDDGRLSAENVTGGTGGDDDGDYRGGGYRGGRDNQQRSGYNRGRGSQECFNFRDTGSCRFGDECRFSHEGSSGSGFSAPPRRDNGGRFGRPQQYGGYDNDRGSSGGSRRGGYGRQDYRENYSGDFGGRGGGVCFSFRDYGNCRHGDNCKFSHE